MSITQQEACRAKHARRETSSSGSNTGIQTELLHTLTTRLKAFAFFFINLLLASYEGMAIVLEWSGNGNSLAWSNEDIWKGKGFPDDKGDEVKFKKDLESGEIIDLSGGNYSVKKLTVENGGNFTLSNGTLISDGEFKVKDSSTITLDIVRSGKAKYKIEDDGSRLIIQNTLALGSASEDADKLKIKKGGVLEFGSNIDSMTIYNEIKIEDGGGRIEGNANLTIVGSLTDGGKKDGTLTFNNLGNTIITGDNSGYDRNIAVASGSLTVDSSAGDGSLYIDESAWLGGSGSIGGDLFVDGTLDLSSGISVGGDIGFGNNANIELTLGSSMGSALLSGLVDASGMESTILTLILDDSFEYGTSYGIFGDTSIVLSDFESINVTDPNNNPLDVSVGPPSDGSSGIEIAVPELKSAALVLGLFGLSISQLRRTPRKAA